MKQVYYTDLFSFTGLDATHNPDCFVRKEMAKIVAFSEFINEVI